MDIFVITLFFLIISPICAYIIYRNTEKGSSQRQRILKKVLITASFIVIMTFFGVSTISQTLDWIILGILLFCIYLTAWFAFDMKFLPKVLRILIGVGLFLSLSFSLLSCTIGLLGTAWIIGDYDFDKEKKLSKTIIYREYIKGNALSDYRLKEIVILRRPRILPFIEYRIARRKYYNWDIVFSKLDVDYIEDSNTINLKGNIETDSTEVMWTDTIYLNKKN